MLLVNGAQVPASSRKSDALRAYGAKGNVLQLATRSTLRFNIKAGPVGPERAFCSTCGKYVPVAQLKFWFEGETCAFYQCSGGCKPVKHLKACLRWPCTCKLIRAHNIRKRKAKEDARIWAQVPPKRIKRSAVGQARRDTPQRIVVVE